METQCYTHNQNTLEINTKPETLISINGFIVLSHFLKPLQALSWGLESIFKTIKNTKMGNFLYIIAVILIIGWAIGFFAFNVGAIIHILLVIAMIAILFRIIQGRKIV